MGKLYAMQENGLASIQGRTARNLRTVGKAQAAIQTESARWTSTGRPWKNVTQAAKLQSAPLNEGHSTYTANPRAILPISAQQAKPMSPHDLGSALADVLLGPAKDSTTSKILRKVLMPGANLFAKNSNISTPEKIMRSTAIILVRVSGLLLLATPLVAVGVALSAWSGANSLVATMSRFRK